MRVLVTGSSGRIGSAIAKSLSAQGEVRGLDCIAAGTTQVVADIADAAAVDKAVRGMDAIVHVAALHAPHVGKASEQDFRAINVDATQSLLDAALRHGVSRFVLTSTTSVYGCTTRAQDAAIWVNESLPPNPEDIYDETKLAAEVLLAEACGQGLSGYSLRMSRCFPERPEHVAFFRLFRGVDRRDVVAAHELAVTAKHAGYRVLNVSSQTPFLPEDCAELYVDPWAVIDRRLPGARAQFAARGWVLPGCIDRVYAVDAAREALGYDPHYGFMAALEDAE